MKQTFVIVLLIGYIFPVISFSQLPKATQLVEKDGTSIQTGADQMDVYLSLIQGKKVAVAGNHTSFIKGVHLVDTLLKRNIKIVKVFSPEHGFRGDADAGELVTSGTDKKTGITIISLYGKNKKPTDDQLKDIDVVVFDMQDVGTRFYTYISTMTYLMDACARNGKKMIVLDRPNPNGHYVDGPVLDTAFRSFVGMHRVPVVHGMTIAEYAMMVNGENWLESGKKCDLKVITCKGYDHLTLYKLPVKPSPNLPNMSSVYLYPTLCLFEGTVISVGRGTDLPFQVLGHPLLKEGNYKFTPRSIPGAAKKPLYEGQQCNGFNLSSFGYSYIREYGLLYLFWLKDLYQQFPDKEKFFTNYFNTLAGNSILQQQIKDNLSEEEIRKSWQKDLNEFKIIRKKYLLYTDFTNNGNEK